MKPSPHLHRSNDTSAILWPRSCTFVSTLSKMQRSTSNHIVVHASTLSPTSLSLTYFNSLNSLHSLNTHHSLHHHSSQTLDRVVALKATPTVEASTPSTASRTTRQTVVSSTHVRDAHIRIVCMYTAADNVVRLITASRVVHDSSLS
jgi:hypothetical protein